MRCGLQSGEKEALNNRLHFNAGRRVAEQRVGLTWICYDRAEGVRPELIFLGSTSLRVVRQGASMNVRWEWLPPSPRNIGSFIRGRGVIASNFYIFNLSKLDLFKMNSVQFLSVIEIYEDNTRFLLVD